MILDAKFSKKLAEDLRKQFTQCYNDPTLIDRLKEAAKIDYIDEGHHVNLLLEAADRIYRLELLIDKMERLEQLFEALENL